MIEDINGIRKLNYQRLKVSKIMNYILLIMGEHKNCNSDISEKNMKYAH